ncbi:sigma-54 interaction domain-containing protein [Pedobacter miscanthi]|jgi:transcriptional regulator with GAF, ATPase, and Fis domain|uniref:Fis family transcriptional regulator n=1 Tax=Pedobacter miscanthi TaxID=2259170 RepID=A0A366KYM6_9SPHI|nr:sigma 54-interacting transcriptional regulator [Pedobacter miscanthi]RBQ06741.1 Fis family transcriptional regulator [Pedobacter miscanthi]
MADINQTPNAFAEEVIDGAAKKNFREPLSVSEIDTVNLFQMLAEMLISSKSITCERRMNGWIAKNLKTAGILRHYFISYRNPEGGYSHFFDSESRYAPDPDFKELLLCKDGFGGIFNLRLAQSDLVLEVDVAEAFHRGGVSPWIFFLKRIGIQKIIGLSLNDSKGYLGTFWFEPVINHNVFFRSVAALLSMILSNIFCGLNLVSSTGQQGRIREDAHKGVLKSDFEKTYSGNTMIIGKSSCMLEMEQLIQTVAPSSATVLISGETGTGKELIARRIHECSLRKENLMVKVNCATLPASLIESELFGHEKGAFTGAVEKRIGKFELAHKGTLFLDEIGEMPLDLQVKLLRAIQEKEIQRLGGSSIIKVDVRVIAATNRGLLEEVNLGRFRNDLYYRLNVFPIHANPLRERSGDINELATFFLEKIAARTLTKVKSLSKNALSQLNAYSWPGNVRELEHLLERSVLINDGAVITSVYLPDSTPLSQVAKNNVHSKKLGDHERSYLLEVLRQHNGKISGINSAANTLGIPPSTLSSKIIRFGIQKDEYS